MLFAQVIPQGGLLALARKSRYLIAQKVRRFQNVVGTQVAEKASRRKRSLLKLKKPKKLRLARRALNSMTPKKVKLARRPLVKMRQRALMRR